MDDDDPLLLAPNGHHGNASTLRVTDGSLVNIGDNGDLILAIADSGCSATHSYRVSTTALRHASTYFDNLLDPRKFNEGTTVNARLATLRKRYSNISQVPPTDLPKIVIADVGQFPKGACCRSIIEPFLDILHGSAASLTTRMIPTAHNIALLAIIADRFSSFLPVSEYVKREGLHTSKQDAKEIKRNIPAGDKESFWRQRVLTGMLLNVETWVTQYSSRLIIEGSRRWIQRDNPEDDEDEALWCNLPSGLEEELAYRRACVLDTINSLQNHFLALYTSKQRQCKLGYDSSPQCDSFQLGEM
ncbi:hypothetical protein MMC08_007618, partial [Hypocenomyce scalaris]|nr:hypothetical protein [Hypocenomyce scalaris]